MRAAVALSPRDLADGAALSIWAQALLRSKGIGADALAYAEHRKAPAALQTVMKAAIDPMASTDADMETLAASRRILTAFAPQLQSTSVFFALLPSMLRAPLRTRIAFATSNAATGSASEGQAIGISRFVMDGEEIEVARAAGIVVVSEELMRTMSAGADAFMTSLLRDALSPAVDGIFLSLMDGGPSLASVGGNAVAASVDLRRLYEAVALKAGSRPIFAMAEDVARAASTMLATNGNWLFPDMTPQGGTIGGAPVIVSDQLAARTVRLFDGAAIAGDALAIDLKIAKHATLQFNSTPDSPETATTVQRNLWQHNQIALQPFVYFGAKKTRSNAVATLTNVGWGGSDSPA